MNFDEINDGQRIQLTCTKAKPSGTTQTRDVEHANVIKLKITRD